MLVYVARRACGRAGPAARRRAGVLAGALVGIALVSSYGLATRLFPDRFDASDDPFNAYRLAEPLGYWNSFGLLAAMGVILAVGVVAHARRARRARRRRPRFPCSSSRCTSRSRAAPGSRSSSGSPRRSPRPAPHRRPLVAVALAPASVVGVVVRVAAGALTTEDAPAAAAATREGHRLAWVARRADRRLGAPRAGSRIGSREALPIDATRPSQCAVALALVRVAAVVGGRRSPSVARCRRSTELRERFEAERRRPVRPQRPALQRLRQRPGEHDPRRLGHGPRSISSSGTVPARSSTLVRAPPEPAGRPRRPLAVRGDVRRARPRRPRAARRRAPRAARRRRSVRRRTRFVALRRVGAYHRLGGGRAHSTGTGRWSASR